MGWARPGPCEGRPGRAGGCQGLRSLTPVPSSAVPSPRLASPRTPLAARRTGSERIRQVRLHLRPLLEAGRGQVISQARVADRAEKTTNGPGPEDIVVVDVQPGSACPRARGPAYLARVASTLDEFGHLGARQAVLPVCTAGIAGMLARRARVRQAHLTTPGGRPPCPGRPACHRTIVDLSQYLRPNTASTPSAAGAC